MNATPSKTLPATALRDQPPALKPAVLAEGTELALEPTSLPGGKKVGKVTRKRSTTTKPAGEPVVEAAAHPPQVPTAKAPVGAVPADEPAKALAKQAKLKLVRDSFTIPRAEYAAMEALKGRALKLERSVKKSELLRAGLLLLARLDDAELLRAVDAVPRVKTGRPKKAR